MNLLGMGIGGIIETHMVRTGFLVRDPAPAVKVQTEAQPATRELGRIGTESARPRLVAGRSCPRCAELTFVKRDGCWTCESCGFSRCN